MRSYWAMNTGQGGTGLIAGRSSVTVPDENQVVSAPSQAAYFGLVLFFLVYCARPEDWIPGLGVIPLAKIAGVFCLLSFLASVGATRPKLPPEMIYLILLVTQLWLTVPMSPVWHGGAFQVTLDFSKVLLIMFVMTATVTTLSRLRQLLFLQTACVVAVAGVTLIKGQLLLGRIMGAINGIYANSNELALTVVFIVPLCLAFLIRTEGLMRKAAWAAASMLLVYTALLTGSRAGLLALLVSGGICLWEFGIRGRRPGLVLLAGGLGLALIVTAGGTVSDRFHAMFNDEPTTEAERAAYASARERQDMFWKALEVTAEHPLFGIGPGNFNSISGHWKDQHNSYTQMSSEGGLPAFVFYLLILWCAFANLRATRSLADPDSEETLFAMALRGSLAGFVVGSSFAASAYHFFPYFLVGYTSALLAIVSTNKVSETHELESVFAESYGRHGEQATATFAG